MKFFFTVTKKSLGITLSAVIVLFLIAMWSSSLKLSVIDGSTHAKRMEYINSLGVEIDEENFTSKETVIPAEFSKVYKEYNKLQKRAGFDLGDYKGKNVTVYSYPLLGENKNLTLLVYDNNIIGGDIAETKINGKMVPLGK